MKLAKRILSLGLEIGMMFTMSVSVSAYNNATPPPPTEEQIEIIERNNEYFETYNPIRTRNIVSRKILNVYRKAQESNDTCSLAAMRMVLSYNQYNDISEDTLAGKFPMSSYPNGPSTDAIVRVFDDNYSRVAGDYSYYELPNNSNAGNTLRSWITDSVNHNLPVIIQLNTQSLPGYGGKDWGHYVTAYGYINGYQGTTTKDVIVYHDPWYEIESKYQNAVEISPYKLAEAVLDNDASYIVKRKV